MKESLPLLVAIVVSLALGVVIGRQTSLPDDANGANSTHYQQRSTQRASHRSKPLRHASETIEQRMQRIQSESEKITSIGPGGDWTAFEFSIWQMTKTMSPEEIRKTMEAVKDMDLSQRARSIVKTKLYERWAKIDGKSAAEYSLEDKSGQYPEEYWYLTTNRWLNENPLAVESWYHLNKDQLLFSDDLSLQGRIMRVIARKDLGMALSRIEAAEPTRRESLLKSLGSSMSEDPVKIGSYTKYLSQMENQQLALSAMRSLVSTMGRSNPEAATKTIASWTGENKDKLVFSTAVQWVGKEPQKAMNWQLSQSANASDDSGIAQTFSYWARGDPDAAEQWLDKHPELNHDRCRRRSLTWLLYANNFHVAAKWAAQINDASTRSRSLRQVYSKWQSVDQAGAKQWLNALPENDQAALNQSEETK